MIQGRIHLQRNKHLWANMCRHLACYVVRFYDIGNHFRNQRVHIHFCHYLHDHMTHVYDRSLEQVLHILFRWGGGHQPSGKYYLFLIKYIYFFQIKIFLFTWTKASFIKLIIVPDLPQPVTTQSSYLKKGIAFGRSRQIGSV